MYFSWYKKTFKDCLLKYNMRKLKWFKTKKVAAVFATVAFVIGFLFLDKGIAGNVILENNYPVNFINRNEKTEYICGYIEGLCDDVRDVSAFSFRNLEAYKFCL